MCHSCPAADVYAAVSDNNCVQLVVDLSLAVPVTNALTLVFTAVAGRLIGEDVGLSMYF